MNDKSIAATICEESDGAIYVSNIASRKLVYMNKTAIDLFKTSGDYHGKTCYETLHGFADACPFCTSARLSTDQTLVYGRFDEQTGRHFLCRDKLIVIDGEPMRLQIATDSTLEVEERRDLESRLAAERTLVLCARTLSKDASGESGLNDLLRIIGEYYRADRAYLLETSLNAAMVSNTLEWCAEGVKSQMDFVQNVPLAEFDRWLESFKTNGMVRVVDLERTIDHNSVEYQFLAAQGITSLFATPLYESAGVMSGILGIDNPRRNTDEVGLLISLSYFVQNDLEKKQLIERLGELSRLDALTGVGNRTGYVERLRRLTESNPVSFGVVFADINDLKCANDAEGHSFGDMIIQNAGRRLCELFPNDTYRIGGDEFVAFAVDMPHDEFEGRIRTLNSRIEKGDALNLSIGVVWSDGGEPPSDLVMRADALMYEEKRAYHRAMSERIS